MPVISASVNLGTKVPVRALVPASSSLSASDRTAAREAMRARMASMPPAASTVLSVGTISPAPSIAPSIAASPAAARPAQAPSTSASPLQRRRVKLPEALALDAGSDKSFSVSDETPGAGALALCLKFTPVSVDFGAVAAGSVYRVDVALENSGSVPLPVNVPSHYTYHSADGESAGNTACIVLPDDEQLGLISG